MDLPSVRCLINSISRFIHLVTCRASKIMPAEEDYRSVASLLKHLKPVLDDVADQRVPPDEILCKEAEKLDVAVNEAREFLEKWSPKMSKILCVLQSKPMLLKIEITSVNLSSILLNLFESSPTTPGLFNAQMCMQEAQKLKVGKLSEHMQHILTSQKEGAFPDIQHLMILTESLSLKSNPELLNEFIALEKERQKVEDNDTTEWNPDQISEIVGLMSHIRGFVLQLENFKSFNGIQIPSYFRCPLSLELMSDPVIVASGQTYERAAIEKWLDHGLMTCPKTGNILSHRNLTQNYTVKSLIENWHTGNQVEPPSNLDPTTQSSVEVENGLETLSVGNGEEKTKQFNQSSPDFLYIHSRSESASSAVSSIDYLPTASTEVSRISSKHDDSSDKSGEITSFSPIPSPSSKNSRAAPLLSGRQYNSSKTMAEISSNENRNASRSRSLSSDQSGSDDSTTTTHVEKLVKDLKSASVELQTSAAGELRFLSKFNIENRFIIGQCGAISPLISLLHSNMELTKEHAVTALLNLSISEKLKAEIAEEGAVEPLIHVLRTGNPGAKENAAAALFSLSLLEEYRIKIGRSGAVKALVDLLGSGTVRGKKDAATALFNLSIYHENKARIVQAGAMRCLVGLMDPASELVDKAVAIVANLSTITEGCSAIAREGGISLLVEIVEMGSQRGKENAASILLQMCLKSPKYCQSVLQEGAVPPLVALSQSGTPRAKEKAQQLLGHFRSQRESAMARGRS